MFERCSLATRYGRFLSPVPVIPARHLDDVLHPTPGRWSWLVTGAGDDVVALASLFRSELRAAEVGLLVEDAEQRQGHGTHLLDRMTATARDAGITTVIADALVQSHHVRRMFGRLGSDDGRDRRADVRAAGDSRRTVSTTPTLARWRAR